MNLYILKYKEFLKHFSKLPQKQQICVIPTLIRAQINVISEICQNFLNENLTTCPKIIRKLKSSKKQIKTIGLKKTPMYKKKQILLTQSGGGVLLALLPIAAKFNRDTRRKTMKEFILLPKHTYDSIKQDPPPTSEKRSRVVNPSPVKEENKNIWKTTVPPPIPLRQNNSENDNRTYKVNTHTSVNDMLPFHF